MALEIDLHPNEPFSGPRPKVILDRGTLFISNSSGFVGITDSPDGMIIAEYDENRQPIGEDAATLQPGNSLQEFPSFIHVPAANTENRRSPLAYDQIFILRVKKADVMLESPGISQIT